MIQERVESLSPYFKGLKIADEYCLAEFFLKPGWEIQRHDEIDSQKTESTYFFYSDSKTLDEILDWVESEVINYNLEIEEKERLLAAKVEELKEMFQTTSLEDLNKLKFTTDSQSLKLNNKRKNEDNKDGTTKELSGTGNPVKEEV